MAMDIEKVKPIDLANIDSNKNYEARIALGANLRWRNFSHGEWRKVPETERDGKVQFIHEPAIHDAGVVSGDTLRGLASAHNQWLSENRSRELVQGTDSMDPRRPFVTRTVTSESGPLYKGDVHKMLLVVSYKETNRMLTEASGQSNQLDVLRAIVQEAVAAAVPAAFKIVQEAAKK